MLAANSDSTSKNLMYPFLAAPHLVNHSEDGEPTLQLESDERALLLRVKVVRGQITQNEYEQIIGLDAKASRLSEEVEGFEQDQGQQEGDDSGEGNSEGDLEADESEGEEEATHVTGSKQWREITSPCMVSKQRLLQSKVATGTISAHEYQILLLAESRAIELSGELQEHERVITPNRREGNKGNSGGSSGGSSGSSSGSTFDADGSVSTSGGGSDRKWAAIGSMSSPLPLLSNWSCLARQPSMVEHRHSDCFSDSHSDLHSAGHADGGHHPRRGQRSRAAVLVVHDGMRVVHGGMSEAVLQRVCTRNGLSNEGGRGQLVERLRAGLGWDTDQIVREVAKLEDQVGAQKVKGRQRWWEEADEGDSVMGGNAEGDSVMGRNAEVHRSTKALASDVQKGRHGRGEEGERKESDAQNETMVLVNTTKQDDDRIESEALALVESVSQLMKNAKVEITPAKRKHKRPPTRMRVRAGGKENHGPHQN
jgi:hypothetical protein